MQKLIALNGQEREARVLAQLAPRYDVMGELSDPEGYLWIVCASGGVVHAAHRALVANGCVYLRGVFRFDEAAPPLAGYVLGREVLAEAVRRGLGRSHVWLESKGLERNIAKILGVRHASTLVHRFRLPTSSVLDWVTPDSTSVWVVDGDCAIVHPPFGSDGLPMESSCGWTPSIPSSVAGCFQTVEFAAPASNLNAGLEICARGGKRLSRMPAYHATLTMKKAKLRMGSHD